MKKILFVSTANAARSQMAEALANYHFPKRARAYSAGVNPTRINPHAIEALEEIGIDVSGLSVNSPDDFENMEFDYVITLCDEAKENCPVFWTRGEAVYQHMGFENPESFQGDERELMQRFRNIRDEIEERLLDFFDRELPAKEKPEAYTF